AGEIQLFLRPSNRRRKGDRGKQRRTARASDRVPHNFPPLFSLIFCGKILPWLPSGRKRNIPTLSHRESFGTFVWTAARRPAYDALARLRAPPCRSDRASSMIVLHEQRFTAPWRIGVDIGGTF